MPIVYKCKLCGKEFDDNDFDEINLHFRKEHGITNESQIWENITTDFRTSGLSVKWKCKLCGEEFEDYNSILEHIVEHNTRNTDEVILSEFIQPIVTVDEVTGEQYSDGSMYWWPLFEVIEELIDNELINDEEFNRESTCTETMEVYTASVGINIVRRVAGNKVEFDLVFTILPLCEFSPKSFMKFVNTVINVVEKVTGVSKDKYKILLSAVSGNNGSMTVTNTVPGLQILIPLNNGGGSDNSKT